MKKSSEHSQDIVQPIESNSVYQSEVYLTSIAHSWAIIPFREEACLTIITCYSSESPKQKTLNTPQANVQEHPAVLSLKRRSRHCLN